jgi:hypothetical protein
MTLFVSSEVLVSNQLIHNGETKRCTVCPLFEPDHPDYEYASTGRSRNNIHHCSFCSGEGATLGVDISTVKINGMPQVLHAIVHYPGKVSLMLKPQRGNNVEVYDLADVVKQNPQLISPTKVEW